MKLNQYLLSRFNLVPTFGDTKLSHDDAVMFAASIKMKYNILLDKSIVGALTNEMTQYIDNACQQYVGSISNTFYANFPADVPDDGLVLIINAINHYLTGDLDPLLHKVNPDMHKDEPDYLTRIHAQPTLILKTTDDVYQEAIRQMLDSHLTLNEMDYRQLLKLVTYKGLDLSILKQPIHNRFAAMTVQLGLDKRRKQAPILLAQTLNDVVKYLQVIHLDYVGELDRDYFLKHYYSHREQTCILRLIHYAKTQQKLLNFNADLKSNLGLFKALFTKFNYHMLSVKNQHLVDEMKQLMYNTKLLSADGIVKQLLRNRQYHDALKQYPTMAVRHLSTYIDQLTDDQTTQALLTKADPAALIATLNAFRRWNNDDYRVVSLPSGFNIIDGYHKSIPNFNVVTHAVQSMSQTRFKTAYNQIKTQLNAQTDDEQATFKQQRLQLPIDYRIPTNNNTEGAITSMPFTTIQLPDDIQSISVYCKWYDDVDLDLSAGEINSERWCFYGRQDGLPGAKHSGDITHNPHPNEPVAERIKLDLDQIENPIMFDVIVYCGYGNDFADMQASLGIQVLQTKDQNRVLGENQHETIFTTPLDQHTTHEIACLYDPATRQIIIINKPHQIHMYCNNAATLNDTNQIIGDFILDNVEQNLNLKELFKWNNINPDDDDIYDAITHHPDVAKQFIDAFYA